MKKTFVLGIVLLLARGSLSAQTATVSAGGDDQNLTGSLNFTIGQTLYTTSSNSNEEIIQGIQIPYDISILVSTNDFVSNSIQLSIYPNPTEDFIKLEANEEVFDDELYYELHNSKSIKLSSSAFSANQFISMRDLNSGVYLLTVRKNNQIIKTFKVIKK